MSRLKIRALGERVIRQKCEPVKEITPEIKKIIADMFETMYAAPGVGLAASQVGIPIRLCVIDVMPGGKRQPLVLINPRLTGKSGTMIDEEGCLSVPGFVAPVKRHAKVRVEAVNGLGFPVVIEGEGLLSRALQHELDHLEGKVFIDRLSWFKKKKIEREIRKKKKRGEW